ncbi:hypothetical protein E2C05_32585, partial [Paracraurococcus ruber]|uniref:hypothetical protein n=1 Tax=Paracraurococcus ruber TaxID=77675 RepID=UPI00195FA4B1
MATALPVEQAGRPLGGITAAARLDEAALRPWGGEAMLLDAASPGPAAAALPARLGDAAGPVRVVLPGRGPHLAQGLPVRDLSGQVAGTLVLALPLGAWDAAARRGLLLA